MRRNNSRPEDYYKQTNNARSPFIACFPTSMINAASIVHLTFPTPAPGSDEFRYSQPEDRYDAFLHSDIVLKHFENDRDIQSMIEDDYDYREIYAVEEWAFNKWIGKPCCRFINGITKSEIVGIINAGGAIVTSGKFSRFKHVVCIVGYIKDDHTGELTHIIIDDSYGDPRKDYKPVGVGGNDVELPIDQFWSCTDKGGGNHFGIVFLPNGVTYQRNSGKYIIMG